MTTPVLTPASFVEKWKAVELSERAEVEQQVLANLLRLNHQRASAR
jgi:hypothetical protein